MKRLILILFFVIAVVHIIAGYFDWYDSIWYLDDLLHFSGGVWVALFFIYFAFVKNHIFGDNTHFFTKLIIILGFVALVGVLWEFYEYLADVYLLKRHPLNFAPNPLVLPDTLFDLFLDLLGSVTAASLGLIYLKRKLDSKSVS